MDVVDHAPCADAEEAIGIARIQLAVPAGGVSAVTAEFIDADRALAAWNAALRLVHACSYTVLFIDGVALRGRFVRAAGVTGVLPLQRIIGMGLGVGSPARGYAGQCTLADRHGAAQCTDILRRYALNHYLLFAGGARRPAGGRPGPALPFAIV